MLPTLLMWCSDTIITSILSIKTSQYSASLELRNSLFKYLVVEAAGSEWTDDAVC
jgi:hypothetical protein